jgi:hypothetical protein
MSAPLAVPQDRATYPQLYRAAQAALFRCEQVDECQQWASKAAAIASYAKQACDSTLEDIAKRIRARAVRRMGELLEKIPHAQGARATETRSGTRTAVARAAGLSVNQQSTALQVARVPLEQFESRVEATPPATIAQLSEIGISKRGGRNLRERKTTMRVHRFATWCSKSAARDQRRAINAADVRRILTWCKEFLEAA